MFSFLNSSLTRAEELSLPYYLPIVGGRIIGFIPFPRVLVQCEMQSVSSRIWTRVAVSISYDDNYYTTDTSSILWYINNYWLFNAKSCDLIMDLKPTKISVGMDWATGVHLTRNSEYINGSVSSLMRVETRCMQNRCEIEHCHLILFSISYSLSALNESEEILNFGQNYRPLLTEHYKKGDER